MKHILVFDCSGEQLSVSLKVGDSIQTHCVEQPRQHARQLLPIIKNLHAALDVPLNQIELVGLGVGPGSFTGLRIAVSCAQALSYTTGCDIVALSSLQAMALSSTYPSIENQHILCLMDARMNELYWGLYQYHNKQLVNVIEDRISAVSQWSLPAAIERSDLPLVVLGAGAKLVDTPSAAYIDSNCQIFSERLIDAVLARAENSEVLNSLSGRQLEAVYLRASNAWKTIKQQPAL